MPKRACAGEWHAPARRSPARHVLANQQFRLKLAGQQDRVTLTQRRRRDAEGGRARATRWAWWCSWRPTREVARRASRSAPTRDGKLGFPAWRRCARRVRRRAAGGGAAAAGARQLPVPAGALHARGEGRGRLRPRGLLQFPFESSAAPEGASAPSPPPAQPPAAAAAADGGAGAADRRAAGGAPLAGRAARRGGRVARARPGCGRAYVDADFSPEPPTAARRVASGSGRPGSASPRRVRRDGARAAGAQLLLRPSTGGPAPGRRASGGGAEGAGAGSWPSVRAATTVLAPVPSRHPNSTARTSAHTGALLVLASRPELPERCFVRGAHEKRRARRPHLRYDRWELVLTDDRVPCVASLPQPTGGRAAAAAPLSAAAPTARSSRPRSRRRTPSSTRRTPRCALAASRSCSSTSPAESRRRSTSTPPPRATPPPPPPPPSSSGPTCAPSSAAASSAASSSATPTSHAARRASGRVCART